MKTLVKKILKTTLTSLKGYVQFKQNSWDKKSEKNRLKKSKKLVLKPIIFNFESIETNFCFVIFEILGHEHFYAKIFLCLQITENHRNLKHAKNIKNAGNSRRRREIFWRYFG